MLSENEQLRSVEMDYQRTKAVLGSDVVQSAVGTARQREQAIEEQRYAVRRNWAEQDRSKEQLGNDWICVNPGICQGRMIGGNLNTMEGFFGTEYMPEIKEGDILFIEDSLKDACTIERSFSLLKLSGVVENACSSARRPEGKVAGCLP